MDEDEDEGGNLLDSINHHVHTISVMLGWIALFAFIAMVTSILTYCHSR